MDGCETDHRRGQMLDSLFENQFRIGNRTRNTPRTDLHGPQNFIGTVHQQNPEFFVGFVDQMRNHFVIGIPGARNACPLRTILFFAPTTQFKSSYNGDCPASPIPRNLTGL